MAHLLVPYNRRHYALPLSAYPASFQADVEAWLHPLGGEDLFNETGRVPVSPATRQSNRLRLCALAAALVLSGRDPASINALSDLVAIDAARTALAFFWHRAGKQKTGHLHNHAMLLVKLARQCVKVPGDQLQRLRAMCKQVEPGRSGMTERNRARLRQFGQHYPADQSARCDRAWPAQRRPADL